MARSTWDATSRNHARWVETNRYLERDRSSPGECSLQLTCTMRAGIRILPNAHARQMKLAAIRSEGHPVRAYQGRPSQSNDGSRIGAYASVFMRAF